MCNSLFIRLVLGSSAVALVTWNKKGYHGKMLRAFLVVVAVSCLEFLSGCATSKSKSQASDDNVIREPARGSDVHGEVGIMFGNNLSRR